MSFFKSMNISSSGLAAQRERMNILSTNLANAQATRGGEDGGPYRRQDVIFTALPTGNKFADFLDGSHGSKSSKVKVTDIHKDQSAPRLLFDPGHPDANKEGYVEMPNVQVMTEMVNMIASTRAFEANSTALNSAKQMAVTALQIGR